MTTIRVFLQGRSQEMQADRTQNQTHPEKTPLATESPSPCQTQNECRRTGPVRATKRISEKITGMRFQQPVRQQADLLHRRKILFPVFPHEFPFGTALNPPNQAKPEHETRQNHHIPGRQSDPFTDRPPLFPKCPPHHEAESTGGEDRRIRGPQCERHERGQPIQGLGSPFLLPLKHQREHQQRQEHVGSIRLCLGGITNSRIGNSKRCHCKQQCGAREQFPGDATKEKQTED